MYCANVTSDVMLHLSGYLFYASALGSLSRDAGIDIEASRTLRGTRKLHRSIRYGIYWVHRQTKNCIICMITKYVGMTCRIDRLSFSAP